jgi:cytoskeletal protein CcmA (bactofilin family)
MTKKNDPLTTKDAGSPSGTTAFLGPSFVCTGQIAAEEDLVIQGSFKGNIRLKDHKLTIAPAAKVEADIDAGQVEIAGHLTGNIRATGTVSIFSAASMKGDISAPKVSISDGAQFRGLIRMDKPGS